MRRCRLRILEFSQLAASLVLVVNLKAISADEWEAKSSSLVQISVVWAIVASALVVEIIRACRNYWRNSRAVQDHGTDTLKIAYMVTMYARMHNLHYLLIAILCAAYPFTSILISSARDNAHQPNFDQFWLPIALSIIFYAQTFLKQLFGPWQRLGVLWRTTEKMITDDVAVAGLEPEMLATWS